jgi:hypothetical protein
MSVLASASGCGNGSKPPPHSAFFRNASWKLRGSESCSLHLGQFLCSGVTVSPQRGQLNRIVAMSALRKKEREAAAVN